MPADVNGTNLGNNSVHLIMSEVHFRQMWLHVLMLVLVMAAGIPGNALVLAVFVQITRVKRQQSTQMLVFALAVTDLTVCALLVPLDLYKVRYYYSFRSEWLCDTFEYLRNTSVALSCSLLTAMAVERYQAICSDTVNSGARGNGRRTFVVTIVVLVLGALVLSSPTPFFLGIQHRRAPAQLVETFGDEVKGAYKRYKGQVYTYSCEFKDEHDHTLALQLFGLSTLLFFVCLIVTSVVCYGKIYMKIRRNHISLRLALNKVAPLTQLRKSGNDVNTGVQNPPGNAQGTGDIFAPKSVTDQHSLIVSSRHNESLAQPDHCQPQPYQTTIVINDVAAEHSGDVTLPKSNDSKSSTKPAQGLDNCRELSLSTGVSGEADAKGKRQSSHVKTNNQDLVREDSCSRITPDTSCSAPDNVSTATISDGNDGRPISFQPRPLKGLCGYPWLTSWVRTAPCRPQNDKAGDTLKMTIKTRKQKKLDKRYKKICGSLLPTEPSDRLPCVNNASSSGTFSNSVFTSGVQVNKVRPVLFSTSETVGESTHTQHVTGDTAQHQSGHSQHDILSVERQVDAGQVSSSQRTVSIFQAESKQAVADISAEDSAHFLSTHSLPNVDRGGFTRANSDEPQETRMNFDKLHNSSARTNSTFSANNTTLTSLNNHTTLTSVRNNGATTSLGNDITTPTPVVTFGTAREFQSSASATTAPSGTSHRRQPHSPASRVTKAKENAKSSSQPQFQPGAARLPRDVHSTRFSRQIRVAKILLMVTGAFLLCFLPFWVLTLVYMVHPHIDWSLTGSERMVLSMLYKFYFVNNAVNPVLFALYSPEFRRQTCTLLRAMRDGLCCGRCACQVQRP